MSDRKSNAVRGEVYEHHAHEKLNPLRKHIHRMRTYTGAVKLRHVLSKTLDHVRPRPKKGGVELWGRVLLWRFLTVNYYFANFSKTFSGGLSLGRGHNTVNITLTQYFGFTQAASLQL